MANEEEHPSAEKEPPWLPILPPMPRISVSTNSRARLSHRRPFLLPPPISTPASPPVVVAPLPALPSFQKSPYEPSESHILETLNPASPTPPVVVVPSSPSRSSRNSPDGSVESPILETLDPPPPPSSASLSRLGSRAEAPSAVTSSSLVDCADSTVLSAANASSDAVSEPVNKTCFLSNDDSSESPSSVGAISEFMHPPNSGQCIMSTYSSHSSVSFPMARISSPPAAQTQRPSSFEDDDEAGIVQENAAGLVMGLVDGVNEAKYTEFGNCRGGFTPSDTQFAATEASFAASCLSPYEEVDDECRGADMRVHQEICSIVSHETDKSDLLKDDELVLEGQLAGYSSNGLKDGGVSRRSEDYCTSSDCGLTFAGPFLSSGRVNALEEVQELKGADSQLNQENCCNIGREHEISDFVKNEELVPEEGELEEGQLPGEWSGVDESHEDAESARRDDTAAFPPVVRGIPMIPKTMNVADQIYYPFGREVEYSEQRGPENSMGKGKKKVKHKKGEGSKKRAREKSKEKHNEVLKKRRAEGKWVDSVSNRGGRNSKDCNGLGEQTRNSNGPGKLKAVRDTVSTKAKVPTVDDGPEDGEILLEPTNTNNGILSSLVDADVGLWTTDNVDDQFITEMEEDGAVKKKRGPETAERKLKRKIAKRKKRAQKERELGIRRPPRTVQSKPVKVLCTHYMKGRCAKGDQCTFSHDAVPWTKQEPCKFLMSHSCLKGDDCPYSHDLRAFPCKFFHTRGLCYDGAKCQFSHEAISEEALEKLKQRVEKEKKERISTTAAFDIPTPSFSTSLPTELDPDPFGWGTQDSHTSHEEQTQHTNSTSLDQSNIFWGDVNLENHANVPEAASMMSGESDGFPLVLIDRRDTNFGAANPLQIEREAKECKYLESSETKALESDRSVDSKRFNREAESSLPTASASPEDPFTSTIPKILNTAACTSPSHERSNARDVLEVPQMEGKIHPFQSSLGELLTTSKESSSQAVLASSLVSPLPAKIVVPLIRGRQLGSLVLEHKKAKEIPLQVVSKKQHTVESLLDEALRQ